LCREYFTTPEFRSALAQHIFEQLSGTH
jgi:hypothetical protein